MISIATPFIVVGIIIVHNILSVKYHLWRFENPEASFIDFLRKK